MGFYYNILIFLRLTVTFGNITYWLITVEAFSVTQIIDDVMVNQ